MMTNQQLRGAFLSPQMKCYFDKKLSPLPSAEVEVRVEETLKFLNMATYIDGSIPVSPEIDEVWHYWILETQEYAQLCSKLQGGQFLHHKSNDYAEYLDKDVKAHGIDFERDVAILGSYVLNYGPFEQERARYWLLAAYLLEQRGWSIDELNRWLGRARDLLPGSADVKYLADQPPEPVRARRARSASDHSRRAR